MSLSMRSDNHPSDRRGGAHYGNRRMMRAKSTQYRTHPYSPVGSPANSAVMSMRNAAPRAGCRADRHTSSSCRALTPAPAEPPGRARAHRGENRRRRRGQRWRFPCRDRRRSRQPGAANVAGSPGALRCIRDSRTVPRRGVRDGTDRRAMRPVRRRSTGGSTPGPERHREVETACNYPTNAAMSRFVAGESRRTSLAMFTCSVAAATSTTPRSVG